MNLGIVMKVVEWMFHELSLLFDILWRHSYWVGMFVIGLPLLKKVVDIFRRLCHSLRGLCGLKYFVPAL